ncbi:paraquat-inducible protein A [Thiocapsa marina]|uniref:Integral membrane protein, PqiA family n=1 Tax=Thiocapsa marina 5811 TaxID=768671 RepID=F9UB04_9GAMM|nr:paraquat-inducible protein A [Thiocapsa marina]EGV18622.1 integral membrane protein, PqiA family [Thiocapsa marina 5811]
MAQDSFTACLECGLLQRIPEVPTGGSAQCVRCGGVMHRNRPDSLNRTLALTIAGLVLFIVANGFPFLAFEMQGRETQTTLITGVIDLYRGGDWPIAAVVLFTSILAPGLQLALLLMVLVPLAMNRTPPWLPVLFRWVRTLVPWGMMDVFMVGILVAVVKLADMASIVPGASLFAFAALIFVLAAAQAALDPDLVWSRVPITGDGTRAPRRGEDRVSCDVCELVIPPAAAVRDGDRLRCPRCRDVLHRRKPQSLQRTWALLIAAVLCYIPANVLPIMSVTSLGSSQSDTIFTGVRFMLDHGMWPLALVIFTASIFVPLLKLLILIFLLVSVQRRSDWRPRQRTRLYRVVEAIGRWSMVDVYVVTILVALVRLGNLASVQAELGAVFFCAVVVLTMLAAMSFDPRLIWDAMEQGHVGDRERTFGASLAGSP